MKTIAVDASAAASWIFRSQATAAADAFLMAADERRLIGPSILPWEIGNQILNRARRMGEAADAMLDDLRILDIEIETPPSAQAVLTAVETARTRGLSLFDNAYLQLCLDRGAALASRDAALLDAARAAGVEVHDLRD